MLWENKKLEATTALAKKQLELAKASNERNKSEIISAKQELRENTVHSISGLWGSEGFEALAELSQYVNPVMNKIADFEAVENKIVQLEKTIRSPYFARIDFKFEDEQEFEKIYIGRSSLMDEDAYEMAVYDWRSPIASVFYRFVTGSVWYDAPSGRINGELNLKRQYEIKNGVLEYFFDADVQIVDEFLRKLLAQNTSARMKTIVETIQREQDLVIRDLETDLMMVQGVAGSGKTSIALHRAAYLMYQGLSEKLSAESIVIISPNTLFEQYISDVLPELGEKNTVSFVFEEIMRTVIKNERLQSREQFLEFIISGGADKELCKKSMEWKGSAQFAEILLRFVRDLPRTLIVFEDVYYQGRVIASKTQLREKLLSGRQGVPLAVRLKQLEDFILEPLPRSEAAFIRKQTQIFTELNPELLYRKLFEDEEYFYTLAKGLALPDNINELLNFTKGNLQGQSICYDDAVAMTFLAIKLKGCENYRHIRQVVIDEAQDYYPLHYEIFNLLFPNAKYTVLGDINQTFEKREDISFYKGIEKILNRKKSALVTLDKSFRCTNEILDYSLRLLDGGAEIKCFGRTGDEPVMNTAKTWDELSVLLISEINYCREKGYQSIALLCKTGRNARVIYEHMKNTEKLRLVKSGDITDMHGVMVIPVYLSKGLEFDAVLICDADDENYRDEDDKKILYVACTRALHRLNLFCQGKASRFLI